VIVTGPRKGQVCGKVINNGFYCYDHYNDSENGCSAIIIRGRHKGQLCGKKRVPASQYCRNHELTDGCPKIIIRGIRKGRPCGKRIISGTLYCSNHNRKNPLK